VKRLITHSGIGTGNGVALKRLPPDGDIWADIYPLDVFQCAASGVVQERARANGRVTGRRVAKKGERSSGRVAFARAVAEKGSGASGRIFIRGVRKERPCANTCAEVAGREAQERVYAKC
jgi:hypothetical protein